MATVSNKVTGSEGELELIRRIPCPNCSRKLMLLPSNYPIHDTQCTWCLFRAQIKTSPSKPHNSIRGAGWSILSGFLRTGGLMPPLFVYFRWKEGKIVREEIRFYPFVSKENLRPYTANIKPKRQYEMFVYRLGNLKYYTLYSK